MALIDFLHDVLTERAFVTVDSQSHSLKYCLYFDSLDPGVDKFEICYKDYSLAFNS